MTSRFKVGAELGGFRLAPLWFRSVLFDTARAGEVVLPPYVGGPTQEDADALAIAAWRARVEANIAGKRRPRSPWDDPCAVINFRRRLNR
jgi:hypothetical protein